MICDVIFKSHFYNHRVDSEGRLIANEGAKLPPAEEMLLTEMCYLCEEFFYPKDEVIFNKGDELDGLLFVASGQVEVLLQSGSMQEFTLDKLFKRCSYGYHGCLEQIKNDELVPQACKHKLLATMDTVILKLNSEILLKMAKRSKLLANVFEKERFPRPACDFTTFLTYNQILTRKQLICKFKRAVRRQI